MPAANSKTAFRWATGIEGSFIPHADVDQYEWTQHEIFWKEDLQRAAVDLGCRWIRYPIPWHKLETAPGKFDWAWADERFAEADRLGLSLMVDLVHFGVPTWLPDAFSDLDLPEAVERFARKFGERYRGRILSVCPINEPLITALFCGDIGLWPPYCRGLKNYVPILSRISQAFCRAVRALRDTMPGVEIVSCDSLEVAFTNEEAGGPVGASLRDDIARRLERRHLPLDLALGRVTRKHKLFALLEENGFTDAELSWFARNRQRVDIVGLDYYPHTEVELYTTAEGFSRQRAPEVRIGLYRAAQDYWRRYKIPLMITETSCAGDDARRVSWFRESVADVRRLREEGFPVVGYTWWPMIDHIDWDGAMLHRVQHIHAVGIYRLERNAEGDLLRIPTALRDEFRTMARSEESVGRFQETPAPAPRSAPRRLGLPPASGIPIVAHARIPWGRFWDRTHHLLSRLSTSHPVLYVEPPAWLRNGATPSSELSFPASFPGLAVLKPRLPASFKDDPERRDEARSGLLLEALRTWRHEGTRQAAIQWFADLSAANLLSLETGSTVICDCEETPPSGWAEEKRRLVESADLVFARTLGLRQAVHLLNANALHLPDGVQLSAFRSRGPKFAPAPDVAFIPFPRIGFYGAIDSRIDFPLVAALKDRNPSWNIVMIGPLRGIDPAALPRRDGIFWIGERSYAEMPSYLSPMEAVIFPYILDETTELMLPAQMLECMATGKPTISTALPALRGSGYPSVRVGHSVDAFIEHCRQAIYSKEAFTPRPGIQFAAERDWEKTAALVESEITGLLAGTPSHAVFCA